MTGRAHPRSSRSYANAFVGIRAGRRALEPRPDPSPARDGSHAGATHPTPGAPVTSTDPHDRRDHSTSLTVAPASTPSTARSATSSRSGWRPAGRCKPSERPQGRPGIQHARENEIVGHVRRRPRRPGSRHRPRRPRAVPWPASADAARRVHAGSTPRRRSGGRYGRDQPGGCAAELLGFEPGPPPTGPPASSTGGSSTPGVVITFSPVVADRADRGHRRTRGHRLGCDHPTRSIPAGHLPGDGRGERPRRRDPMTSRPSAVPTSRVARDRHRRLRPGEEVRASLTSPRLRRLALLAARSRWIRVADGWRRLRDLNPGWGCKPQTALAVRRHRPD